MSDPTPDPVFQRISDWVISHLRTAVPMAWGPFVTWLLLHWPWLKGGLESIHVDLNSLTTVGVVTGLVSYAWYAIWRLVQRKWGAKVLWLSRIFLGSSAEPTYSYPTAA